MRPSAAASRPRAVRLTRRTFSAGLEVGVANDVNEVDVTCPMRPSAGAAGLPTRRIAFAAGETSALRPTTGARAPGSIRAAPAFTAHAPASIMEDRLSSHQLERADGAP
jgi:hypothetical protein